MCPSYRATRNEKDVTRGRANTLRLAISGQLGPDALSSDEMMDTLKLCVSCKACRHECPTGVDMAKMKIEVLAARAAKHGLSLRDRLVGYLPRYAGAGVALRPARQLAQPQPAAAQAVREVRRHQRASARCRRCGAMCSTPTPRPSGPADGREVVLFADTFNRAYERENLDAALRVLVAGGYRVHMPSLPTAAGRCAAGARSSRPGLVDQARAELDRLVATYAPFAARGVPIVGLEPSCLLTLRDELLSLRSDDDGQKHQRARAAVRGISGARGGGRPPAAAARRRSPAKALVHGHCHQKSFGAFKPVEQILRLIPDLERRNHRVQLLRHGRRVRLRRRHLSRPRWRWPSCRCCRRCARADAATLIVADGTSCRHQIKDGADRAALHVARVLAMSLDSAQAQSQSLLARKGTIHG